MAPKDGFRKYVEAASVLGQITKARAEDIVHDLVEAGDLQRGQAQQWVDDLVDRSLKASEEIARVIRSEITNQLGAMGLDPESLAKQVTDLVRHSAAVGRKATTGTGDSVTRPAGSPTRPSGSATRPSATRPAGSATRPSGSATRPAGSATRAAAKKATATRAPAKKAATATRKATTATRKATTGARKATAAKKSPGSAR